MKRSIADKMLGLSEDVLASLRGTSVPLHKVLDREYVAAWREFSWSNPQQVERLVDVSAHNGLFARRASLYFPLKRTIMVEAISEEAAKLRELHLPGREVVQAALAEAKGRAKVCRLSSGLRLWIKRQVPQLPVAPGPALQDYSMFVMFV